MKPAFLHAANPGPMTGDGNWTYLIGGAHPLLIDAGVGEESHLEAIAAAAPNGLDRLLVTHAHSDHIAGAPAIHQRWPAAVLTKHPWPIRDRDLPWTPINDGAVIATDEGDLHVMLTPGHAPDHLTLWHPESRTVFVGDMMQAGNTVVIPASHGGSLADYLRSLDRIKRLNPARALPAHGPVIDDPLALIDRYVEHRRQRETQVLDALTAGANSVDAITDKIYPSLDTALVPMARESVLAHLHKLQAEQRVAVNGSRWSIAR
jgi:glyoxylase-like metal-dependent hydrolase (beta-lactamase superfamily II)